MLVTYLTWSAKNLMWYTAIYLNTSCQRGIVRTLYITYMRYLKRNICMIYHFLKCFHSELVELVWYISIDTSIAQLTLFRIIRCFLVMSSVLEVWPKGVRWQAWGAGRRRWRCVLTYRTANCNFHSNFNCECNVYMMLVVQTLPAVQTFSASLY